MIPMRSKRTGSLRPWFLPGEKNERHHNISLSVLQGTDQGAHPTSRANPLLPRLREFFQGETGRSRRFRADAAAQRQVARPAIRKMR